jgi:hypothetical protein
VTPLLSLVGAALILVALRDIFDTLFHPSGKGMLSRALPRLLWRGVRRIGVRYPLAQELCGPATLLCVIASWATLLAAGWAFVFWPHLTEGFLVSSGPTSSTYGAFVDALYLSLVTLTTLGYGDVTPTVGWLKVLVPLEALVGFGLLTASLSWVVSLYPVFSRHRSLAHEVSLASEAESETGIGVRQMDALAAEQMLGSMTTQLIAVQTDLVHFPISYYFRSSNERFELSAAMSCLLHLAQEGDSPDCAPGVRMRARMLRGAIEDFSETVGARFLDLTSTSSEEVLEAYARDNLHTSPELEDLDDHELRSSRS